MNFKKIFSFLLAAFACVAMFCTSVAPAFASQTDNTTPRDNSLSKGAEPMEDIERKSKEVIDQGPRSLDESRSKQGMGLNLVQGNSDKENVTQETSKRGQTTLNDQVEDAINKLTGNR